jgi:ribosome-associated protein
VKPLEPLRQALLLAGAALDKKAIDPVLLQVSHLVSYADYLLVVTANSRTHAEALLEACRSRAKEHGLLPRSVEGVEAGKWVLADFGDVVLHIFGENERMYYDLESLWTEAPRVDLPVVEPGAFRLAAAGQA